ncbi:hypothetical protein [Paenibacillus sp. IHBB 10380]|uniref:hypothetical protein n=1 Tax=Paenibacillus sp. IHBB 10380 TaxID=1566358 RepID=UPI0005CFD303|nr:hypothetical protein [Paenibacillus sp. IHBB 10380]AJS60556.1 hypothetical protein UB51_21245 [Paenibacillus sp. IHBB 10380]
MNRVANVMKMHSRDKWSWFIIPWVVMLSVFIINLVISVFIDDPMYTGAIASVYVYMFIAGIVTLAQTFPFALGMSVSRTDYFLGTSAMIILTSVGFAVLMFLLGLTEGWTGAWGSDLHFFHLPYLSDGPVINQFLVPLVILLFMRYLGIVIAATHKRTGRSGLFIASGILLLVFTVLGFLATYLNWYPAIFDWMVEQSAVDYTLWMLPLIVIFAVVSYLLLRRATI